MDSNNNDGHRNNPSNQGQFKPNQLSDKRKPYQQQFHGQRDRSSHRERSGQRNQGQHPDSSMSRADSMTQNNLFNLGSVRFTPGLSTLDLSPIETKLDPGKKFSGRCRLFVGNLPHDTSEDKVRRLFESYGEVGEIYLGPKSAFAFVKMDTRQNAEAARDALDCTNFGGRSLRVRLAAHAAAIRIKHIPSQVTNELLAYAFRFFGEIERAVVVVDDKGKSTGEGIVEYAKKQSALYAIKKCQQECFMLTSSPQPVLVEPYDQHDEEEGLPEKSINKLCQEFKEQRETGPRFAEPGTFEQTFGSKWKELYYVEKQKRDRLEEEIQEARNNLRNQINKSRLDHEEMQLRNRLQQLEDNRSKLQQLQEQSTGDAHKRNQDMMIRHMEEDVLRRQQANETNNFNQTKNHIQIQANKLQDFLNNHVPTATSSTDPKLNQLNQHQLQQQQPPVSHGIDTSIPMGPIPIVSQVPNVQGNYADATMVGLSQTQYIPVHAAMNVPPPHQSAPNLYTAFMPAPHTMQMGDVGTMNPDVISSAPDMQAFQDMTQPKGGHQNRQQKVTRNYNNSGNMNLGGRNGRPRKRGKF